MKDAAKKFRKTCEKCNKPFSTANESEVLCRECRICIHQRKHHHPAFDCCDSETGRNQQGHRRAEANQ